MREMLGVALECPAYPQVRFGAFLGVHPVRSSQKSRGVSSHPQRSLAAPPSVRQSGASSDAPDAFSTVSILHTTCAATSSAARCPGAIYNTTTARVIRYRRALPFLPPPGLDTTPTRIQAPTALPAARAARDAGVPRRLPAHRDSSALYCRHRPTPASAVLPSTTFIASCVRSACDGRSPSPAPLSSPPRAPSASPASTTLPDPHARRALACTTPRVRSTCSNRSPSPAHGYHLPARRYRVQRLIILHSRPARVRRGRTTRSIAGARSKCNEHSPSPTPPSSPPRAPRLSSAPTPATARNLGLPRTANRRVPSPVRSTRCSVPPSPHTLRASHVHPQPYTAPLVDDSARRLRLPR
ncbi:hypothetical protein B0H14DRAFT_44446 [Mycena olivaceomarginata]|nr:hypothetical protein B0H14DRAFT_44446 [Mycena olivaceomarginata]